MWSLRSQALLLLLSRTFGQDFFEVNTRLAKNIGNISDGFLAKRSGLEIAHPFETSNVFTIYTNKNKNLCLDVTLGHGVKLGNQFLQTWECNGLENQLWYFDPGSWQIRWAGDNKPTEQLCIDAQGMSAGTQLFVWNCNGLAQQTWGYDPKTSQIFLGHSLTGYNMCMDVAGGVEGLGVPVQVWNCNTQYWGQSWGLRTGINIRALANYNFCLDLSGGKTDNGTPLQIWECNGLMQQQWIWDSGTYQIASALDNKKCIDGGGMQKGYGLMIWDCNGLNQQQFGFDSNVQTVYLTMSAEMQSAKSGSRSGNLSHPMASLCMDISAGTIESGTVVDMWECNSCWNQQWQVIGPAPDGAGRRLHQADASKAIRLTAGNNTGGCPDKPAPPPSPAPGPLAKVLPHCSSADDGVKYGWPKFATQADLQKSPWAAYFKAVYGEVPTSGYPICTFSLTHLYKPILASAKVTLPTMSCHCPTAVGQYYDKMTDHQDAYSTWIWNSNLAQPQAAGTNGLPENYWVEIIHQAYFMDGDATWLYYAPGTAIWLFLGKTKVWDDHDNAVTELLKQPCQAGGGWAANQHQCIPQFGALYAAAKKINLNTMQFTKHSDMPCGSEASRKNMAIEIVDLGGSGKNSCGMAFPNQATKGVNHYHAGWEAKSSCSCDNAQKTVNCKGFGMQSAVR